MSREEFETIVSTLAGGFCRVGDELFLLRRELRHHRPGSFSFEDWQALHSLAEYSTATANRLAVLADTEKI